MIAAMQGVAGKGRGALASDDKYQAEPLHSPAAYEVQKTYAGFLQTHSVQINAAFNLDFAAHELLFGATVKPGNGRRRFWEDGFGCGGL